jgi:hypothetical protein
MKLLLGLMLAAAGALLAGCAAHPPAPAPAAPPRVIVTPDHSRVATVVLFNPVGRFVVLDFPTPPLPANGQVFFLYHGGLKAGEVKITGPQREHTVVADLSSGEARAGDEVRDE